MLQNGVFFQGYQLGGFLELSVLFLGCFGNKKPWSGQQVVDRCDEAEEEDEHTQKQVCNVEGPAEEDGNDHEEVDGYQGQGDCPMGEAPVEQEVVDMIPVGAEGGAAMQDADAEHPQGIEKRYHQNGKANGRRCGNGEGYIGSIGHIDEFDHQYGIDRPDEEGTGVPHEDLGRLKVEDQESQKAAGQREGDHGIRRQTDILEVDAENNGRKQAKAACQAIDPIDEVEGIDHHDDGKVGEQETKHLG